MRSLCLDRKTVVVISLSVQPIAWVSCWTLVIETAFSSCDASVEKGEYNNRHTCARIISTQILFQRFFYRDKCKFKKKMFWLFLLTFLAVYTSETLDTIWTTVWYRHRLYQCCHLHKQWQFVHTPVRTRLSLIHSTWELHPIFSFAQVLFSKWPSPSWWHIFRWAHPLLQSMRIQKKNN